MMKIPNFVIPQAGGLPDISRWLSDEVATPPDHDYSMMHPGEAPDAKNRAFWHPSGMRLFLSITGGVGRCAPSTTG